jgi:hypothetical protein
MSRSCASCSRLEQTVGQQQQALAELCRHESPADLVEQLDAELALRRTDVRETVG